MNLLILLFIFFNINFSYSCDNIEIHKKIIDNILKHEDDKILKTKHEYLKYGIKEYLLKKYKKNYSLEQLSKNDVQNIALDLMKEYRINTIKQCNLKFLIYDFFKC